MLSPSALRLAAQAAPIEPAEKRPTPPSWKALGAPGRPPSTGATAPQQSHLHTDTITQKGTRDPEKNNVSRRVHSSSKPSKERPSPWRLVSPATRSAKMHGLCPHGTRRQLPPRLLPTPYAPVTSPLHLASHRAVCLQIVMPMNLLPSQSLTARSPMPCSTQRMLTRVGPKTATVLVVIRGWTTGSES